MAYRPCRFRSSTLGIFQCEKHMFHHSHPEIYDELYEFCLVNVPDRFGCGQFSTRLLKGAPAVRRMDPFLLLSDVEGPVVVQMAIDVKGSELQ